MAVAALSLGLAGLAYAQRNLAQENERRAEASQRRAEASQQEAEASQRQAEAERDRALLARARAMGSLSNQVRSEGDVLRSALVGIEAAERAHAVKADAAPVLAEIEESLLGSLSQLREQVFADLKSGIVRSAGFNSDGTKLVAATDKGAKIIDAATGKIVREFDGDRRVSTAAFSPDGSTVLTGGEDETAFLWDARTGVRLGDVIRGHPKRVWDVRFSPDGAQFLTTAEDGKIRIWDTRRKMLLYALGESPKDKSDDTVRMAVFTSDGKQIVACHQENGTVRIWDLASRKVAAEFKNVAPKVYSVSISPDGSTLAVGGWNAGVDLFDVKTRKKTLTLNGHEDGVFTVAFSPDGKRIASGARDATVRLWDASSGENVAIMRGHVGSVYRVAFSADGQKLTSASVDGQVRVWDATFAVESRMRPADPALRPAKIEAEMETGKLYSYSFDGTKALRVDETDLYVTEVWDVHANKRIASIRGLSGVVNTANFSPDGSKVVTAERNGLAQVWNTDADKLQFLLRGHSDQMQDAQFSPDGKLIATAGRDATARLWDADTGAQIFVYRGHKQPVDSVSFSPDSSKLMTSGADGRIRVWSTRSGVEILSLRTHDADQGAVSSSAAFSKDGRFIFVETVDEKSGNKTIEVGLSGQELIERAIGATSRCLTLEQRQQMSLDRDPPHWCIELEKWPYNRPEWKQWLAQTKAGNIAAFPTAPEPTR
jgi:WD40 repeat protein